MNFRLIWPRKFSTNQIFNRIYSDWNDWFNKNMSFRIFFSEAKDVFLSFAKFISLVFQDRIAIVQIWLFSLYKIRTKIATPIIRCCNLWNIRTREDESYVYDLACIQLIGCEPVAWLSTHHTVQQRVQRNKSKFSITKIQYSSDQRKWLRLCAACFSLPSYRSIQMCCAVLCLLCCAVHFSLFLLLLLLLLCICLNICVLGTQALQAFGRLYRIFCSMFLLGFSISLCLSIKSVGMQTR